MSDLSWTEILYEPAFRLATFLPLELTSVMVKPGPTLPVSAVAVGAAPAWLASAAATSAATAPAVIRFFIEAPLGFALLQGYGGTSNRGFRRDGHPGGAIHSPAADNWVARRGRFPPTGYAKSAVRADGVTAMYDTARHTDSKTTPAS